MTVIAIGKDPPWRTMTLEAEFEASPERVWQRHGACSTKGPRPT